MSKKKCNLPTIENWVKQNVYYDQDSGDLFNTNTCNKLGSISKRGYLILSFTKGQKLFQASSHRVAWFLHFGFWPVDCLDHINGDRLDNRIENLRESSIAENNRNLDIHRNGHSLYTTKYQHNTITIKRFLVNLPLGYSKSTNKGTRGSYSYSCEYQAQMAAHMCETGEFNPLIHCHRIVNFFNETGIRLKKMLTFSKPQNIFKVQFNGKNKKVRQFKNYEDAINFHNIQYGDIYG